MEISRAYEILVAVALSLTFITAIVMGLLH